MSQLAWKPRSMPMGTAGHRRRAAEHETGDELRMLVHQFDGDVSAERPAEDHTTLDAKGFQRAADAVSKAGQGIAGGGIARVTGCAVARQIHGNEAVALGKGALELVFEDRPVGARTMQQNEGNAVAAAVGQADFGIWCFDCAVGEAHGGPVKIHLILPRKYLGRVTAAG
jgi:hypothetical protein